jgi:hypothetical protein
MKIADGGKYFFSKILNKIKKETKINAANTNMKL